MLSKNKDGTFQKKKKKTTTQKSFLDGSVYFLLNFHKEKLIVDINCIISSCWNTKIFKNPGIPMSH